MDAKDETLWLPDDIWHTGRHRFTTLRRPRRPLVIVHALIHKQYIFCFLCSACKYSIAEYTSLT